MDERQSIYCDPQGEGVRQLMSQAQRLVEAVERLVRVAERPEVQPGSDVTRDLGTGRATSARGTERLRRVAGDTLLQVRTGRDELSATMQGLPQRPVCLLRIHGVGLVAGQMPELFSQLLSGLELSREGIKPPELYEDKEELCGLTQL